MTWALWQHQQSDMVDNEQNPFRKEIVLFARPYRIRWRYDSLICVSTSSKHQQQQQYHCTYTIERASVYFCACAFTYGWWTKDFLFTIYTSCDDTFFSDVTKSDTCTHTFAFVGKCTQTNQSRLRYDTSEQTLSKYLHTLTYTISYISMMKIYTMDGVVFVSVGVCDEKST